MTLYLRLLRFLLPKGWTIVQSGELTNIYNLTVPGDLTINLPPGIHVHRNPKKKREPLPMEVQG